MFIIEMSAFESDFIIKNTKRTGAYDIRTFDINHELSLFAYYYQDHIHLKLKRYGDRLTTHTDWQNLQRVGLLYPDINLKETADVYMDDANNQIHIKLQKVYVKENYDDKRY